jgi:hypothetical protein
MSNNLVPKVSITEAVASLAVPQDNLVVIGIIWTSEKGTANEIYAISSVSQADAIFGSNYANGGYLVPMIKKAFQEWASYVKAISIGQPTKEAPVAITAEADAGTATITVDPDTFTVGDVVYLWTGNTYQFEERRVILSKTLTTVTFTEPLTFKHYVWELATVVVESEAADYWVAITKMEEDEDKTIVVCELNDDDTAGLIATMCLNSYNNYNTPCVYFRGSELADTEATVAAKAIAMNDDRGFIIYPLLTDFNGKTVSGGECAAATAGAIAWNGVPRLNHNFTEFSGFGGVTKKIADMDGLISAGVIPVELKFNSIHIVRFVTTNTLKDGIPDYTWQEGAVRLNVDFIEKAISRDLQQKFLQKGNTSQVRIAIKSEVAVMLGKYASMDILVPDEVTNTPAYRTPVVTTDVADRTKVNVDISVSPGRPLNFIALNFKVYL